jgi:hypothetical protein
LRRSSEGIDAPPTPLHRDHGPGRGYLAAMELAGHHANAGRDEVSVCAARLGIETITGRGGGLRMRAS